MDPSVLAAFITGVATIIAAVLLSRRETRKQLQEIHVLVNSRLSSALDKITSLETQVKTLKRDASSTGQTTATRRTTRK